MAPALRGGRAAAPQIARVSAVSPPLRHERRLARAGAKRQIMDAMRLPRGALQSRNFRLLLACDVISGTGSAVATVAIPFAVLAIGGSASDVGYVATAYLIPMIVFLLVGGVAGDRFARHKVMMVANGLQAAAQGASAILVLAGEAQVWQLLVFAGVRGIGLGLYYPASQGLLPQTVPEDQRAQANAISRTGRNSAGIAGAALGGLLVGLAGPGWGLAVDAASFALAAALRAGMRFPAIQAAAESTLHQMREGWREFIARRWLWSIVLEFTVMTAIISGTVNVLGPVVADSRLGGARSWGLILAAYGLGAVLGGLVMMRFRPQRMLLVASIAAGVFAVLLFALAVPLAHSERHRPRRQQTRFGIGPAVSGWSEPRGPRAAPAATARLGGPD